MIDGSRGGHAFVGATQLGRHVRVGAGEALDVHLVDDTVGHRDVQRPVAFPVETAVVGDHGLRHPGGVVVELGVGAVEVRLVPAELAVQAPRIGIEQQARRVVAQPA